MRLNDLPKISQVRARQKFKFKSNPMLYMLCHAAFKKLAWISSSVLVCKDLSDLALSPTALQHALSTQLVRFSLHPSLTPSSLPLPNIVLAPGISSLLTSVHLKLLILQGPDQVQP